jgi:hypothetical protein
MAIVGMHYQATASATVTERLSICGAEPGDLVVITVQRPAFVSSGPAGWNRDGNAFWKVISDGDDLEPRFAADSAFDWEWDVTIARAGTYTLDPVTSTAGPGA